MTSRVNIGMIDGSNEPFSFGVTVADITGANYGALETSVGVLQTDLEALSYGERKTSTISETTRQSVTPSTDPGANREIAVRFLMQDNGGNKSVVSVGAPILDVFPFAALNTDYVAVPNAEIGAEVGALITWLDQTAKHPINGNQLTVYAIEKVGRNL